MILVKKPCCAAILDVTYQREKTMTGIIIVSVILLQPGILTLMGKQLLRCLSLTTGGDQLLVISEDTETYLLSWKLRLYVEKRQE